MANYIGPLDQGTSSTRFMVFDRLGKVVSAAQREHDQIYPQPGWVEHDPEEIWRRTCEVWNRKTGKPVMNALVRLDGPDYVRARLGDSRRRLVVDGRAGPEGEPEDVRMLQVRMSSNCLPKIRLAADDNTEVK